ncbi:MAG: hypothetical protein IPM29_14100 [Planctomycetes bacterium]|nr:hypothetical protein [Planctomycetota bacterium]
MNRILVHTLVLGLAASASAQVTLTEFATIDLASTANALNPEFIGSNPVAVAWNGSQLFVAGYNNSPTTITQCAIVEVLNPTSATPTYGPVFGVVANPPSFRGYSGLDISGSSLAAAFDDGMANADGIACFDLAGTLRWRKNARGGSGVAFDPGFPTGNPAVGRGVAWTTFGSGRRSLQNTTTGADIWDSTNGMVILTPEGSFWRDLDFDDQTGDIYLREGNNVIAWMRTGDNAVANPVLVFDQNPDADFINQQNLAVLRGPTGVIVLYNDRALNSTNQGFSQVVKAAFADGRPVSLDFGSFSPNPGNASYDFSYDAATRTLALLDFSNRNVHLFNVFIAPWEEYGQGCRGSNGMIPTLTLGGDGASPGSVSYTFGSGPANAAAFIVFGITRGSLQLPGSQCFAQVSPILSVTLGPVFLDGQGAGSTTLTLPGGLTGVSLTQQGAIVDVAIGGLIPLITTTAYELTLQ